MKSTKNTILITGGASGIGRGLAEAYLALGNEVIISSRRKEVLDSVVAENPGMKSLVLDISDASSISEFVDIITREYPNLNVLINNAGIMQMEDLVENPEDLDTAEKTIATNLLGPIRLTAQLLPHLRIQPESTVMMVTSGLAFTPLALTPTYSATKAAIHSYTQSLRYQLKDTSVEVLELIPPYVATTLTGEHQASDPAAMPLDEYLTESIEILTQDPTPPEICVKRVLPLRDAPEKGKEHYQEVFLQMNKVRADAAAARARA